MEEKVVWATVATGGVAREASVLLAGFRDRFWENSQRGWPWKKDLQISDV